MGLFLADDVKLMEKSAAKITGMFLDRWWDDSSDAGPKKRPSSSFGDPLPTLEVITVCKQNLQDSRMDTFTVGFFPLASDR